MVRITGLKWIGIVALVLSLLTTAMATNRLEQVSDGVYRGVYEDRGVQQVSIEFAVTDGIVHNLRYLHLYHNGIDYLQIQRGHALYPVVVQHGQLLEYLHKKPLRAIYDLQAPDLFICDLDGFSGATLPARKVLSAMQDGINRCVFRPEGDLHRRSEQYQDGWYRGFYGDRGVQQLSIQFQLVDNVLQNLTYRHLYHDGVNYRQVGKDDPAYPLVVQHGQLLDYLSGKPLPAIYDLHSPGLFIADIDHFSGATLPSNKVFSAIRDGLNRGVYSPTGDFVRHIGSYPDGRYRGTFSDCGEQQVSVQFFLRDQVLYDLSYRHLYHSGTDYRNIDSMHPYYPVLVQHGQLLEYLHGRPLLALYDLHAPELFVEDIDGYTGATLRGNKVFSAIMDGLNRGLY